VSHMSITTTKLSMSENALHHGDDDDDLSKTNAPSVIQLAMYTPSSLAPIDKSADSHCHTQNKFPISSYDPSPSFILQSI